MWKNKYLIRGSQNEFVITGIKKCLAESGIRIREFFGIRDQHFSRKMGEGMGKYNSLRPCFIKVNVTPSIFQYSDNTRETANIIVRVAIRE